MFDNIKYKYNLDITISIWLFLAIIIWPILLDNISNSAIVSSVLFLCDLIRYINKEIRITIADYKIMTNGRDIDSVAVYFKLFFWSILTPITNKCSVWIFFSSVNKYSPIRLYTDIHIIYISLMIYSISLLLFFMKKKWLSSLDTTIIPLVDT